MTLFESWVSRSEQNRFLGTIQIQYFLKYLIQWVEQGVCHPFVNIGGLKSLQFLRE